MVGGDGCGDDGLVTVTEMVVIGGGDVGWWG